MSKARSRRLLKVDPTRTISLVRGFSSHVNRIWARLRTAISAYIKTPVLNRQLATLPTANAYAPGTDPQQLEDFKRYLAGKFLEVTSTDEQTLWQAYLQEGYSKGAGRAFQDTKRVTAPELMGPERAAVPGYQDARDQFLRSAFARPETIAKVKLLASRTFSELEGVTGEMSTRMSRILADGMSQGASPQEVARNLNLALDLGKARAMRIARSELVRSHAEGTLDALEQLGVKEVGVEVEWATAKDPCPKCAAMKGKVFSIEEARGKIPRHPNCRCAWLPAVGKALGEDEQMKGRKAKLKALLKGRRKPVRKKARGNSADTPTANEQQQVEVERPDSVMANGGVPYPALLEMSRWLSANVYCATGPGGGVDPSCKKSDSKQPSTRPTASQDFRSVISADPDDPLGREALADHLEEEGRASEAKLIRKEQEGTFRYDLARVLIGHEGLTSFHFQPHLIAGRSSRGTFNVSNVQEAEGAREEIRRRASAWGYGLIVSNRAEYGVTDRYVKELGDSTRFLTIRAHNANIDPLRVDVDIVQETRNPDNPTNTAFMLSRAPKELVKWQPSTRPTSRQDREGLLTSPLGTSAR